MEIFHIVNAKKKFSVTICNSGYKLYNYNNMKSYLTKQDIEMLRINIPKHGQKKCAEMFNLNKNSVYNLATREKIRFDREISLESFTKLDNKELIYLLGFFWADGSISKKGKLAFMNTREDMEECLPVFRKVCDWRTCGLTFPNTNKKDILVVHKTNKHVAKFLTDNGYKTDALKFIKLIPEHLLHYWFLGLVDGDGHIEFLPKSRTYRVHICSAFDENWEYMEYICKKLFIHYEIIRQRKLNKTRNKVEGNSRLRMGGYSRAIKFLDWIYQSKEKDGIGLNRKYETYLKLKALKFKRDNKNGYKGIYQATSTTWGFRIKIKDKSYSFTGFKTKEDAAKAFDIKKIEIYGRKAITNFPLSDYIKD